MNGIDPNTALTGSQEFENWAVYVLVLVILLVAGVVAGGVAFLTTWWVKVLLPESKKRISLMDKVGDGVDALVGSGQATIATLTELKQSHSTLTSLVESQGDEGRRVVKCVRIACELVEKQDFSNAHSYATRMRDVLDEDV